jgi:sugar lactone lactonase YvrE
MSTHSLPALGRGLISLAVTLAIGTAAAAAPASATSGGAFLDTLTTVDQVASTVPATGDQNPYGVAVVKHDEGDLHRGNVLVSNFNNGQNQQGTGTTLMQITPQGTATVFSQIDPAHLPGPCPGGVGLTTALSILPGGWVVVGSLPTSDGTSATAEAGCLLVLDNHGTVRETLAGRGINGPWDMTAVSHDKHTDLFVTNVLNGTVAGGGSEVDRGTVLRITLEDHGDQPPERVKTTKIGSGFAQKTDPAALVIGPTGVGLGEDGTLYVADTVKNRITAIPHAVEREDSAGTGRVVSTGGLLNGPLGLAMAPNGNILTVNGGDGLIVETTPHGDQVAHHVLDKSGTPPGAGALFGLAVDKDCDAVYFVDNATNFLNVLH